MAHTARSDEDKKEYFDSPDELDRKVTQLAEWIKQSRHFIVFTGAGISTSAGIPDFRSGMDTKLETGLYELHGNSNLERCSKCKREYLRDFRTPMHYPNHLTGRKCDDPSCQGDLQDTIINFGETLPEVTLEDSFDHAGKADLCLAMGSSLTVTPAANIPEIVGQRKRLVIVNLQRTPLDGVAALRINGKCDDVMKLLMSKLSLDIPEFRLNRRAVMKTRKAGDFYEVCVEGRDQEDHPFTFLKAVTFMNGKGGQDIKCYREPYIAMAGGADVNIRLDFHSHYGEPELILKVNLASAEPVTANLQYNPFTRTWTVTRSDKVKDHDPTQELASKLTSAKV